MSWVQFSDEVSLSAAIKTHVSIQLIWFFCLSLQSLDIQYYYFSFNIRILQDFTLTHFILYEIGINEWSGKKVLWFIGIFPFAAFQIHEKKISFTSSAGKNERSIEFTKLI